MCATPGWDLATRAGVGTWCELEQLADGALSACQKETAASDRPGWCYVDPLSDGNPELVSDCPETERRRFRFIAMDPLPQATGRVYVFCGW